MLLEDIRVNTAIALQVAVMEGYSDVVRLLLKHPRVDVNEVGTTNMDMTALHWAACNFDNHENVVQDFLDESRVDVNVLDRRQETPLHAAVSRGEVTSVRILIADPRVETSTIEPWRNYTPLLTACDGEAVCENYDRHSMADRVEMIKALLESETINTTEVAIYFPFLPLFFCQSVFKFRQTFVCSTATFSRFSTLRVQQQGYLTIVF